MPPRRILSLLPGATEMVATLGCADRLVGRSHECDFPETSRGLPVCTRTRLEASASSGEIHQGVGRLMEQALSIFELDVPLIRELRPDLILTQAQCEVCAVSVDDVETALAGWANGHVCCRSHRSAWRTSLLLCYGWAKRWTLPIAQGRSSQQLCSSRSKKTKRRLGKFTWGEV